MQQSSGRIIPDLQFFEENPLKESKHLLMLHAGDLQMLHAGDFNLSFVEWRRSNLDLQDIAGRPFGWSTTL